MKVRNHLSQYFILISIICFALTSCDTPPEDPLEKARANYESQQFISYSHVMYWPNPLGEIDTFKMELQFQKHPNPYYDYNYIGKRAQHGFVYIDGIFKEIKHADSTVIIYSDQDLEHKSDRITENMFTSNHPLTILSEEGWKYKQDTSISDKILSNYFLIGMDTTIEDKKICMEKHVFIDPATALLDRMERRLYHNSKKAQFITYEYSNYDMDDSPREIKFEQPAYFMSKTSGDLEKVVPLKEGIIAPDFQALDLDGHTVELSKLRGNKVLLNFSIINCGWCKIALEEINTGKITLPEDIIALYINPRDSKENVSKYIQLYDVPFTVLAESEAIGKMYGVNGYPVFYLINEKGTIEKVIYGYNRELLNNL